MELKTKAKINVAKRRSILTRRSSDVIVSFVCQMTKINEAFIAAAADPANK